MKHAAALALVAWLLLPLPGRAAGGASDQAGDPLVPRESDGVAVPGTLWYLMRPPFAPSLSAMSHTDPDAPLSRWVIDGTYPTKQECDEKRLYFFWEETGGPIPPDTPGLRCLSTGDLARARTVHAPGRLLITAPHDDVSAPLAQWTAANEPGETGAPARYINFSSEKACNEHRACLYGECIQLFTVVQPGIFGSSDMRKQKQRKLLASRCVPDDDPQLKGLRASESPPAL